MVQNGVNALNAFLGWKLIQSLGSRMLEWTKRKDFYGSVLYISSISKPGEGPNYSESLFDIYILL